MRVVGIVVAGGRGTRMGGVEKALLPFGAGTLLDAAIARVRPQVEALALNVRPDSAALYRACEDRGFPLLVDPFPEAVGPLGGVIVGLAWAAGQGADWLATFPCDAPFLPRNLVAALAARASASSPAVASEEDRIQSLCALWPVARLGDLRRAVERDGLRSVRRALELLDVAVCPIPDAGHAFLNVNTPEDLAAAEALIGA